MKVIKYYLYYHPAKYLEAKHSQLDFLLVLTDCPEKMEQLVLNRPELSMVQIEEAEITANLKI